MGTTETELRGRDDELRALAGALDEAASGRGHIVLLEGEAGIGKTRLLDELTRRADAAGLTVRRGSAEELEQDRPFGSLVDALGSPDGIRDLGGSTGGDTRFLAQDAFVDHVERLSSDGPVLLGVDDVHWADRASLATLWALARRSADLGLLLVLAFRPEPATRELTRIVEGATGLGAVHVQLRPIDDAAVSELAADVVGAPPGPVLEVELRRAGGNPFVAIELLLAHRDEGSLVDAGGVLEMRPSGLPKALRDALIRRLTALSPQTRTALSVMSVLGDTGRLEDLAVLMEVSTADAGVAVAEATRAGLLGPVGDHLAFRHDLIREALYQDLPDAVRAGWHRAAAEHLDGRADPAIVARHLSRAARPDDAGAVESLRRAAEAMTHATPDAAIELLERASSITTDDAVRAEILVALADALLAAGRADDAGAEADAALLIAASPAVVARAHLARGEACTFQGRHGEALDSFVAARATGALDEAVAADALSRQALLRVLSFDLEPAAAEADRALTEARRLGLTAATVEALTARCTTHIFRAEFEAATSTGKEAVDLAGTDPECIRRGAHISYALALCAGDRLEEAREVGEAGRRHNTELGQIMTLAHSTSVLVRIAWFAGRWDDAIAEADSHAALASDFGLRFGLTANDGIRGLVAFHRGDLDVARAVLDRHQDASYRGREDSTGLEMFTLLRAEVLEAEGDLAGAATTLLELFRVERAIGMTAARIWPGPACARLAVASGDLAAAREVADDLADVARRAGTSSALGAAAYSRGVVDDDPALLLEAVAHYERTGEPRLDHLLSLEMAGNTLEAHGETADAEARQREALAVAERLGATHDARRVTATLRRMGVRLGSREPRRRATFGWDSLTDAERAVADLVDEGLRNAEIGERLFVSRRTVESHVSRLYAKLGAEHRGALARVIREHRDAPRSDALT